MSVEYGPGRLYVGPSGQDGPWTYIGTTDAGGFVTLEAGALKAGQAMKLITRQAEVSATATTAMIRALKPPTWHGAHGKGAMRKHRQRKRREAEARQIAYRAGLHLRHEEAQ